MQRISPCLVLLVTGFASSLALAEPATKASATEAAEKFGQQIERAFTDRNRTAVADLIDMRALAVRVADYQGMTGPVRDQFIRELGAAGPNQLVSSYFTALDATKGQVRFMRATNQFPPRSLVRLSLGDQGYAYCEFVLATDAAGRTRAVDWWQLATGELVSVTMSNLTQLASGANPGFFERALGIKPDEDVVKQFVKISQYQRTGKFTEALEILKNLPEPVASNRVVLTLRASMAALAANDNEHALALEKLAQHHGKDPSTSFMLFSYQLQRQDWTKALAALDTMEKRVGKDGATRLLRASTYLLAEDYPKGLVAVEESIALEPGQLDSNDLRATLLVRAGRFAEAVAAYKDIEQEFGLEFTRDIFVEDPSYAEFVKSAAFGGWLPE